MKLVRKSVEYFGGSSYIQYCDIELLNFDLDTGYKWLWSGKSFGLWHPNFSKGDLVWGFTGREEYTLITSPKTLFKIPNTDVPLSY